MEQEVDNDEMGRVASWEVFAFGGSEVQLPILGPTGTGVWPRFVGINMSYFGN